MRILKIKEESFTFLLNKLKLAEQFSQLSDDDSVELVVFILKF